MLALQLHLGSVEQISLDMVMPALLQQVSMYEQSQNVSWNAAKLPRDGMVVCTLVEQPVRQTHCCDGADEGQNEPCPPSSRLVVPVHGGNCCC